MVYARNAIWDIAKSLNVDYFLVLDDDYTKFKYVADENNCYKNMICNNLDSVFNAFIKYLIASSAESIAMLQGGDLMGGSHNAVIREGLVKRKVMNTFFCSTERRFKFVGRINEDVNTYVWLGTQGKLFLQIPDIRMDQSQTQSNSGGLTEFYLDIGTYSKSFYTVMFAPSCVKVSMMGTNYQRLHHRISWNNVCPKIINQKHRIDSGS